MTDILGTDGNDTLKSGTDTTYFIKGGKGDDTYVIEKVSAAQNFGQGTFIEDVSGINVLDLSAAVQDIQQLLFSTRGIEEEAADLLIDVVDGSDYFGWAWIISQFSNQYDVPPISSLKIGENSYDLTLFKDVATMTGVLKYGAGDGDDIISSTLERESVSGLGGNDTITGDIVYGDTGDDNITADRGYGGQGDDTLGGGGTLYGGDGDDLFVTSGSSVFFGGWGDDTYVVNWTTTQQIESRRINIYEELGSSGAGLDTIDLSSFVDDVSQVKVNVNVFLPLLEISIYNKSGQDIGHIQAYGDVEKLKVANATIDLPAIEEVHKQYSTNVLGATEGDDRIEGGSIERDHLYGFAGNDSILASGPHDEFTEYELYGGLGDDTLDAGLYYLGSKLYGGGGNDTYVFSSLSYDGTGGWNGPTIYEYGHEGSGDNDVLDLTAVAKNTSHISFESNSPGSLTVQVRDEYNHSVASIDIKGEHAEPNFINIEKLVIGDEVIDLTAFSNVRDLEAYRNSIKTGADQKLVVRHAGDNLHGLDGNDTLIGEAGNDGLDGGEGDDQLFGNAGEDYLYGGEGHDKLIGGAGADNVSGGEGDDQLWAGADDDAADGLTGGSGADTMGGGAGDDTIVGDISSIIIGTNDPWSGNLLGGADLIFGGPGDDLLIGGGWIDRLADGAVSGPLPGEGKFDEGEQITSITDENIIWGGAGDDSIYGTDGAEKLGGGIDNDVIKASGGNDVLYGGKHAYTDTLDGGAGADTLYGGGGDDSLVGGAGDDVIFNGGGADTVIGGSGADTLWGGPGDDRLTSGSGGDVFAFASGNGKDTITDFDVSSDKLDLSSFDIADLASIASSTKKGGVSGVRLSLDASTEIFLEHLTMADISNNMAIL